jgi:tetratricopeptide (TPR) repeat protein
VAHPLRYKIVVGLVFLGTGLSAVGGWRYARASAPVSGPIILVSVDSLRADRLPVYGYTGIATPAIDALAADGVVFERAYSHSPLTLPAHASLLSGRLPFETGVRDNAGFTVSRDERLLPEILEARGYATAGIVSSFVLRADTGIAQGFSLFDQAPGGLTRDGAEVIDAAEKWLGSVGTERAFLFVHLYEPHSPYTPPARFAEYAPYDGEVAYVDELVGRLVRYLKAHQLYDQSTIILLADHGEGLGARGESEHGILALEEVLRVPLIVKPAAGEGAGRRVDDVVQHADIMPTVLDLAKAPIPDDVSGRSLKPLLEDGDGFGLRFVYAETLYAAYRFGASPILSVTDGRFRLIQSSGPELFAVGGGAARLQDFRNELNALTTALERFGGRGPLPPPGVTAAAVQQRLAALGYAGLPVPRDAADAARQADVGAALSTIETYRTALAHASRGRWPQAMELLTAILRADPQLADVWHQLGDVAMAAGRAERAADAYARAAALRPGEADSHIAAATALLRLRRFEAAREHAAAAAPSGLPIEAYVEARTLHDTGHVAEALIGFEEVLARLARAQTPLLDVHFYAADALLRLERLADAEAHLVAELQQFPLNLRARTALANVYQQTGRADEAAVLRAAARAPEGPRRTTPAQ